MTATERTLRFLGAAGTVTGSKYWIRAQGRQILLDCGLFQGLKQLRLRNWAPPPFSPAEIDAVVLSHAHIDHSGYLPLLARQGYRGPIYCTPATADLLRVLLPDAAHLQEEDAERANRRGYSKHHPALPLYTAADAETALALLEPHPYAKAFPVTELVSGLFRRAGHILGSATVELELGAGPPTTLAFSGDLGRRGRPILRDPDPISRADLLLVESTYGDRTHSPDPSGELARIVNECVERGGALLIPAFAVGRTQELLWTLRRLEDEQRIPRLPVFVDSPMAIEVTAIYGRHPDDHDLEMEALTDAGRSPLSSHSFHLARTREESKALNQFTGPIIILSASGMATGGRVLHHLKHRLPDPRTTVLLPGFQAAGTRGRALEDGARFVRIHGADVPVRARVEKLDGFSAHADRDEVLGWLSRFEVAPRQTYVVHGEPPAAEALAREIRARLGWQVTVAADGMQVSI
jgi:metallo-beta-lactamase family protein